MRPLLPAIAGLLLISLLAGVSPAKAPAADVYVTISLRDLKLTDGQPLDAASIDTVAQGISPPRIAVSPGAAYLHGRQLANPVWRDGRQVWQQWTPVLAIRAPAGSKVTGLLAWKAGDYFPNREGSWTKQKEEKTGRLIRFETVIPQRSSPDGKSAFFKARLVHYERLAAGNQPGGAYFRYQADWTRKWLGRDADLSTGTARDFDWQVRSRMDDSLGLLTGGRAIAENLQLDRILPEVKEDKPVVDLARLQGITVREFDWKPLVKDLKPERDPLAERIPFDQHAVFFTNFDGMLAVADSADAQAAPVLHALLPHSVNVGVRQRYERQMCLPATAISRLMGPRLVRSVAVTGGDPYLMTGADVAVLFQALNTPALRMMIDGRVATSGAADKEAKVVKGEVDGVAYSGMVSPDRAICSYVATLGDTVVVTNSLAQLKRLVSVEKQETRSLASLDEYTFFRDRYRRGAADEQALLVISDATIRRWCSAKWRIAASRTVRAAAVIADGQAEQMDRLVAGSLDPAVKVNYRPLLDAGQMTLGRRGIQSDRYGSLAFHTPIIEQEFTHVTMREADMYERWRSGYQNNWSNYFDPIAVRLHMSKDKMAADVTVMPLIERSDYRQFIELCGAAQLAAGSGDPHPGALAHFVMALDPDSQALKYYSSLFNHFGGLKTNVLGWIGGSVALYAEDDPFWDEMAKAENQQEFVDKNLHRLPIALQVEVRDPIKMAVFLTAGRTMIDGVVPEMTVWETRKHRDQAYVRITKSPNVGNGRGLGAAMPEKMVLCYAPADDVLIVSLNEEVLKKALDRRADRLAAAKDAGKPAASPWLGQQIAVHLNHRALLFHQLIEGSRYEREMQRLAWDNLPVLNEWHRRFPDAEPVALHERIWHQQLVCPGGGTYRWNEAWQTMESTVYGHPGEPKKGPTLAESFKQFSSADFGLTFEKNGLRAKAELTRAAEKGNVEKK